MSATNRGTVRQPQDRYPTPLESFLPLLPYIPDDGPIWEPAAGDFRLVKAMREYELDAAGTDVVVPDGQDFLEDHTQRFCIVTNPPYSLAFEFCQHAVEQAKHTFLLLRLNFLASAKRKAWFTQHEPGALFVLSKRPSFVGGKTDATDYAWYYWGLKWTGLRHL
jgi:hypothetical protein